MLRFIGQRLVIMVPMLVLVSMLSFLIIQLPPGDYVDTYVNNLRRSGTSLDASVVAAAQGALRAGQAEDGPVLHLDQEHRHAR